MPLNQQDQDDVGHQNKRHRTKKLYENVVIGNFLYGLNEGTIEEAVRRVVLQIYKVLHPKHQE